MFTQTLQLNVAVDSNKEEEEEVPFVIIDAVKIAMPVCSVFGATTNKGPEDVLRIVLCCCPTKQGAPSVRWHDHCTVWVESGTACAMLSDNESVSEDA